MTQDLTVGKPISRIWQFAVPVLFGLLLQQVYSLVDTAIVGHALGVMALGGVGATGSVNFLVLGFCGGHFRNALAFAVQNAAHVGEQDQVRTQRCRQCSCRLVSVNVHQLALFGHAD